MCYLENILLDTALQYADRGWFVFPTREKESKPFTNKKGKLITMKAKTPYMKGGFEVATKDSELIKEWWKKFPEAGIGISCGHSNLVVVDIDTHKGDNRGFENFMKLNVSDEGALHSMTPSGGLHIIYSGLTNSHANVEAGIDLRSQGAYIVSPPSRIYYSDGNNKQYAALDDWNRIPIKVPSDLMNKLKLLKKGKDSERKTKREPLFVEDHNSLVKKAKVALEKLPQEFCEEYFKWVNVGMSLKTLGNDGFILWDSWSRHSSKYDKDDLEYKWDRFNPREISIASLFFWAKQGE
jgi:hypothetical protein